MSPEGRERARAIREEALRARRAQLVADLTCALLAQTRNLSLAEAMEMIAEARREVLALFPDKEAVFNLLYRPRFTRILVERFRLPESEIGTLP